MQVWFPFTESELLAESVCSWVADGLRDLNDFLKPKYMNSQYQKFLRLLFESIGRNVQNANRRKCIAMQKSAVLFFFSVLFLAAQLVTCDTKLRDQCKGTTCNRYEW